MKTKFKIKKGDMVEIISGAEKGATGKVLQLLTKKNAALVEGRNLRKKHMRGTQDNPDGGIVDMEAPIHVSNLKNVSASQQE